MTTTQRVSVDKQHPAAYKALIALSAEVEARRRGGPRPAPGRAAEDPHLPDQRLRVLPAHAHP